MSNKTFTLSTDDLFGPRGNNDTFCMSTEDLFGGGGSQSTQSGLQLTFVTVNSPDSSGNLNDREVNVLEGHVTQRPVTLSPNNNSWVIDVPTPTDNALGFSNENTTWGMSTRDSGLMEDHHPGGLPGGDGTSEEGSPLASTETSRRGSNENASSSSSLASEAMVMRSNTFCLQNETFNVSNSVLILEDTPEYTMPCGQNFQTFLLGSDGDGGRKEEEEDDLRHKSTFLYAPSPDASDEASPEMAPWRSHGDRVVNGTFTPEPRETFSHNDAQISTPVTGVERQTVPSSSGVQTSTPVTGMDHQPLLSLSESPCTWNADCASVHPAKAQPAVVAVNQPQAAKPSCSAIKRVRIMEVKSTPKPDVRSVRSKVMTRPMATPTPVKTPVRRKPPQVNVPSTQSQGNRRPPLKLAEPSPALCSQASSRAEPAAASLATLPGNATTPRLSLKTPSRSNRPDPTPDLAVASLKADNGANRNKVRSWSASDQNKNPVSRTQARCSSEISSSSSTGALRKNRPVSVSCETAAASSLSTGALRKNKPASVSSGLTAPRSYLASSAPRNQCAQNKAQSGAPMNTSREVKKISLVVTHSPKSTATANGAKSHTGPQDTPLRRSRSTSVPLPAPPRPSPPRRSPTTQPQPPSPRAATGSTRPKQNITAGPSRSTATGSSLKRTPSSRLFHQTATLAVDKNRPNKATGCPQPIRQQQQPKSTRSHGAAVGLVPAADTQQHRQLQVQCEALAVVLQKTLAERDEAVRQCKEQSQELVTLRGELVSSVQSCQRVEQQREEMRTCLEERLQTLQEQHQEHLAQLENRMKVAYQQEWDKAQLAHQEEAEKVQNLMEQKMAELKANHDVMRQEVEVRHSERLQQVQQQFENSVEELRTVHHEELQALDKTRKEAEDSLSRIQELTEENNDLTEKLRIEEEKRREHAEKNQIDPHMLYLQQELESLNVVLDMKTQQLHLQESKVLQMDKLTEKSLKFEECLKRVLQENEELKARMERHTALSRQLSTEHEVLQESLQKESQVNKRLSRENEELVWKLHNGDLGLTSSPRRTTSPVSTPSSHSLGLQSPRSPVFFASSSSPVSPR